MLTTLVALLALIAMFVALRWKRPDPHHEYTLDLYTRTLQQAQDEHSRETTRPGNSSHAA
jgi:hypothetical protein